MTAMRSLSAELVERRDGCWNALDCGHRDERPDFAGLGCLFRTAMSTVDEKHLNLRIGVSGSGTGWLKSV